MDGKPVPDLVYTYTRVKTEPPVPNSERLKDLEFIIGTWEAKNADGGTTRWSFDWSADKNLIENQVTGYGPDGKVDSSFKGTLGWDPGNRQITNWSFGKQGNPLRFVWVKTGDKTWLTWPVVGNATGTFTVVDEDTWVLDWGTDKSEFKRVPGS